MPKKQQPKDDKNDVIKDRILVARNFSKDFHTRAKRWNKFWNGTARPNNIPEADYIFVNYVFAIIKNKLSRLYYRNPFINVKAVNPSDEKARVASDKAEPVVNKQMSDRKLGIRGQVKKSLADWQRVGLGAFFVGWSTMLEEEDDEVKSIYEDQPDFRRIHPLKLHLPPSFTTESIPYVVVEVDTPLADLKKNKNYDQAIVKELSPASLSYERPDGKTGSEKEDLARVKTFHYYSNEEIAVYAVGEDEPLLAPQPNPYKDIYGVKRAIPIRFIWGDDDLETEWPIPTTQVMEKLQIELNKTRTQKSNHRKRFNRKYLVDKAGVGDSDLSKIEQGQDGVLVPVTIEGNKDITRLVHPIQDAPMGVENDQIDRLVKDDINVITGSTQVGLSGKSVNDTLGQDEIGERRSQSREDEEQEMVEEFVEEIYTSLLQLDQAKLQTPIAVKINGSPTQEWQEVSAEDIQGEMLLTVVSGSMVRETDDQIRKEAAAISAHLSTIPILQNLLPEVTASILDSYPQFSAVAEKAKEIIKQNEMNPPPPPPPPPSDPASVLSSVASLIKAGVQVAINQVEAALQMAGLPPSTPMGPMTPPMPPDAPTGPSEAPPLPPEAQPPTM